MPLLLRLPFGSLAGCVVATGLGAPRVGELEALGTNRVQLLLAVDRGDRKNRRIDGAYGQVDLCFFNQARFGGGGAARLLGFGKTDLQQYQIGTGMFCSIATAR